jgi:hypothetical protein
MKLDSHKDALPLWERICPPGEYSSDVRHLLRCAVRVDRQDVILKTARAVREAGIDDPWLIHQELNVLQASDIEQAISVLQDYLVRNPDDHVNRLRLTSIGLDLDRPELIDARAEVIPGVADVTLGSGVMAVTVLRKTGRPLEAVAYAYEFYRRFNDDPIANITLFASVFAVDPPTPEIQQPEAVEPGCAVLFAEEGGADTWIVVEDSQAPNRLLGEYPLDDPLVLRLLGKQVGDSFVLSPSMARERIGVIREIVSKYVYRARFIAESWQVRFHDYPWIYVFRTGRKNPETRELELDLTDMKFVADRHFEMIRDAEESYKARQITLHIFAHNTGAKNFEAALHIAATPGLDILCWDGSPDEWAQALGALQDAGEVVVDLSALATLYLFDEEGILRDWPGKLIVSQNTVNQIRECLPDPRGGECSKGRFGKSERGYHFIERDEQAEEEYRTRLVSFLELLSQKAQVCGCETLASLDPEERQTLTRVFGQHGLESMLLSSQPGRVLWSDDAILAALARSEFGARCVWTQVSVEHGVMQGFLDAERARSVGAKLVGFGYKNTVFNEQVVWKAAEIAEWDPDRWPFTQALEQLSNPSISAGDAGRLAVAVIVRLYQAVVFPPSRQRVLLHIAERLVIRAEGLPLVMAIAQLIPRLFGLNVVQSDEVTKVLNAWTAEASRRLETVTPRLLVLPPHGGFE